jgi:hypothetical protein
MIFESKHVLQELPGLRPFDLSFRPIPSVQHTNSPPSPFKEFGFDFTITPPKGHLPPSRLGAASSNQPASAVKHLVDKERKKLMRDGSGDPYNNNILTGEEITAALLRAGTALLPVAISPYGRMGPMFLRFLFGTWAGPHYKFDRRRPMAQKMYSQAMLHLAPFGLIPLATSNWRREKPHTQFFYGNSYTAPTPHEFILQQLGLTISNAIALHIRDAKQGSLSPPTKPFDEDFQPNTTRPAGGRIVLPPPGLTHASDDLTTDLDITPPCQLSPVTFDDTDTTPTALSDLDLSFFTRNLPPQCYRTKPLE